jgi:hypothetical protein
MTTKMLIIRALVHVVQMASASASCSSPFGTSLGFSTRTTTHA